jgi:hypothetical protein
MQTHLTKLLVLAGAILVATVLNTLPVRALEYPSTASIAHSSVASECAR